LKRTIFVFAAIILLVTLVYAGLSRYSRNVSPLVGKHAPIFVLPQLQDQTKQFSPNDMKGRVWLLNIWASWCGECIAEMPVLLELARKNFVPIYGLDYKDKAENGLAWLAHNGNPYVLSILDADGSISTNYGVQGVPVTYVIDKNGVIQFAQVGQVTTEMIEKKIHPLIAELEKK